MLGRRRTEERARPQHPRQPLAHREVRQPLAHLNHPPPTHATFQVFSSRPQQPTRGSRLSFAKRLLRPLPRRARKTKLRYRNHSSLTKLWRPIPRDRARVRGRVDRPTAWRRGASKSGKEEDVEVGLVYFGARYLVPGLGRWASAESGHGASVPR